MVLRHRWRWKRCSSISSIICLGQQRITETTAGSLEWMNCRLVTTWQEKFNVCVYVCVSEVPEVWQLRKSSPSEFAVFRSRHDQYRRITIYFTLLGLNSFSYCIDDISRNTHSTYGMFINHRYVITLICIPLYLTLNLTSKLVTQL